MSTARSTPPTLHPPATPAPAPSARKGQAVEAGHAEAGAAPVAAGAPAGGETALPTALPPIELAPDQRLFNRDLSWLEFNRRVLAQAIDRRTPLLDRVKFLAIFTSNLDEFFMKRVGLLKRLLTAAPTSTSPDGLTPSQSLFAIRSVVIDLQEAQARCYETDVLPALAAAGIHILRYADLTADERREMDDWYRQNVFPVLTPLSVDPGHPFPFISNLSESLGVIASEAVAPGVAPSRQERMFARVKVPDVLARFVPVPPDAPAPKAGDRERAQRALRFLPMHELIEAHLADLFPGMHIHEVAHFRVTRSTGVQLDDPQSDDLLESVQAELKMRRFAQVVRLEVNPSASRAVVDRLVDELRLQPEDIYERPGPLEYTDLYQLADLERPDLKEPVWRPVIPARLAGKRCDIFQAIRERDILLHHPFESFGASVERFIEAAADDPDVLAIKQTLYRTSRDSPFVRSLVRAADSGKQVACLVELRARFDEHRNVQFARRLERAGVHVAYGLVGLKTHCKAALVVRREASGLRCYAHLGTGNYNPKTAQLYTDLSLLTCNTKITDDLISLFNFLTGMSKPKQYHELLVAPFSMRSRFNELIDREAELARRGKPARIIAKINSMEDLEIAGRLYEASRAGVKITLMVRGFCSVRPGVPGLSENINVISVLGRFLEHSRVFYFSAGKPDPIDGDWYIGSADWMYRNLSNRVEAAVPVKDRLARKRLKFILDTQIADHRCAWDLHPDGSYTQRFPDPAAEPDSPNAAGTFNTLMWEARSAAGR